MNLNFFNIEQEGLIEAKGRLMHILKVSWNFGYPINTHSNMIKYDPQKVPLNSDKLPKYNHGGIHLCLALQIRDQ